MKRTARLLGGLLAAASGVASVSISTAAATTPTPTPTPTSTTGTTPSPSPAPAPTLTAKQVAEIIRVSNYQALRSHLFDIADEFQTTTATVIVVQLDGAPLGLPITAIQQDIQQSDALAAATPHFSSTMKVGPEPKQTIRYDAEPAGALAPGKPYVRYVIFTPRDEPIESLTAPEKVPSNQAETKLDADARINVTLLHDLPPSAPFGDEGLSAAGEYAMVESMNTSSLVYIPTPTIDRLAKQNIDLSYMTDPNHPHPSKFIELQNLIGRGREIWSNSLGFAVAEARAGFTYPHYSAAATKVRFSFYRRNDLRYLVVRPSEFGKLGRISPVAAAG